MVDSNLCQERELFRTGLSPPNRTQNSKSRASTDGCNDETTATNEQGTVLLQEDIPGAHLLEGRHGMVVQAVRPEQYQVRAAPERGQDRQARALERREPDTALGEHRSHSPRRHSTAEFTLV